MPFSRCHIPPKDKQLRAYLYITICTKNICIVMHSWWELKEDTGRFLVMQVSEVTEEQIPLSWVTMYSCVCVCVLICGSRKAISHHLKVCNCSSEHYLLYLH